MRGQKRLYDWCHLYGSIGKIYKLLDVHLIKFAASGRPLRVMMQAPESHRVRFDLFRPGP